MNLTRHGLFIYCYKSEIEKNRRIFFDVLKPFYESLEIESIKKAEEFYREEWNKIAPSILSEEEAEIAHAEIDPISLGLQNDALFLSYELTSSYIVLLSSKLQYHLLEFVQDCLKINLKYSRYGANNQIVEEIKNKLEIDLHNEDGYELTLILANVIKHGEGKSYKTLFEKYPNFVNDRGRYSEIVYYIPENTQIILNIDSSTVSLICDNICHLWDKISQALNNINTSNS